MTTVKKTRRNADLRQMLCARKEELEYEVARGVRIGREGRAREGGDGLEDTDASTQADITRSLLQMRSEMLARIEQAIVRFDDGRYGACIECSKDIAEARLRALPFAVRCQQCEGERERVAGRVTRQEQQKGSFWLLSDSSN